MRHRLALGELAVDRGVCRPAAHREIIGRGNHRPPIDVGAAEDEIAGGKVGQFAIGAIAAFSGNLADFAERAGVDQCGQPGAGIQLAARVLAGDLLGPAHPLGQLLALAQFLNFTLPAHAPSRRR